MSQQIVNRSSGPIDPMVRSRPLPKHSLLIGFGVVAIALLAFVSSSAPVFYGHMIVMTLIYAALATSWNIIGGFAGQLSLGHAAFFGLGAYTSSILFVDFGISPWIGLLIALLGGATLGLLIGIPTFRLRGPYFALATLALGIILLNVAVHFRELTGGHVGISLPPTEGWGTMTFLNRWQYVVIAGGYLLVCLLISGIILSNRFGYQLAAVREDEEAARALGVNATRVKLLAGTLSGGLAAGIGTIYAQYILFLTPDSVLGTAVSIEIIVLAIVGGSGKLYGPLLGAVLLIPAGQLVLREFGGALPGLHTLVYGVIVIIVILLFPRGIWGMLTDTAALINRRRKHS
ncbi:branched-chain amino acid ABC transporter permease [Cryobacterium glaciale]|uniref:Branched-chain amino acid ABC transporter permease n=1 Tax=Cryobacterium glaciale TaxID=1259145 RepID=A0A4R8V4I4_9MICO|nr:branched-chain amino acid ABC transporter permease [Cryobacterium glaciale]TFB77298.1 branched-chain amino acid ABC transporter permease [Cryobacterium glaciale]